MDNPIGTGKLEDLVKPDERVVIMVDDTTRPTPAAKILPSVLERIHRAGVPVEAITLFMAMGTHRPMTEEELRIKLGDDIRERYRVVNRDYREGPFVDLGHTESGTPIEINEEILKADFKMSVGHRDPAHLGRLGRRLEDHPARGVQPENDRHDAPHGLHRPAGAGGDRQP